MPNPDSQGIDDEVERIIKRYKKYVERKARYAYEAFEDKDDSFTRASQQIKMQDSEFKFIKEVIYNYLDLDVNKKRKAACFAIDAEQLLNRFSFVWQSAKFSIKV